jgi:hypothetical protein
MSPGATSSQERRVQGEAAARMPQSDVKATVVSCPTPPAEDDFVGTLKGKQIRLEDVKEKEICYSKRTPEETAILRREFERTEKKKFLQGLANDPKKSDQLRQAGLSEDEIGRMRDGMSPSQEWQVHHRLPLDDGGTNAVENLVLIKNDPYHKTITNVQNALVRDLVPGASRTIRWPIPEGFVYPSGA